MSELDGRGEEVAVVTKTPLEMVGFRQRRRGDSGHGTSGNTFPLFLGILVDGSQAGLKNPVVD